MLYYKRIVTEFLDENAYILYNDNKDCVIIDPGFGFGKSLQHNYELLNNLNSLKEFRFPILVGLSRKSFLSIDGDMPQDRLSATICANTIAALNGADILRVHDVDEHIVLRNNLSAK